MKTLKEIEQSQDTFWAMCEVTYFLFKKAYFYGDTIKEHLAGRKPGVYQIMVHTKDSERFNVLVWGGVIKKSPSHTSHYKIKIKDAWIPFTLFSPINYDVLAFDVYSKQLINAEQRVTITDQLIHTSLMALRPARKLKRSLSEGDLAPPVKSMTQSRLSIVSPEVKFFRLFLGRENQKDALKFMEIVSLLDCMPRGSSADAVLLGPKTVTGILRSTGSQVIFEPIKGPNLTLNDFDLIHIRMYNFCPRCKHIPNDLRKQ